MPQIDSTTKKNMRNEFEFMSAVLDALGVEYEEADVKVRERWRSKVLDGWGVEYVVDDLKQFARWRKKCLEGLSKNSGGGGDSSSCPMKMIYVTILGNQYVETNSKSAPAVRASVGGQIQYVGYSTWNEETIYNTDPVNGLALNTKAGYEGWVASGELGSFISDGKVVIPMIIFKGESVHLRVEDYGLTVESGDATIANGVAEITGDCVLRVVPK